MIDSPLANQLARPRTKSAGAQPVAGTSVAGIERGALGSRENPWSWWDADRAKDGDYVYERPDSAGIGPGSREQRFKNMDNLAKFYWNDGAPLGMVAQKPQESALRPNGSNPGEVWGAANNGPTLGRDEIWGWQKPPDRTVVTGLRDANYEPPTDLTTMAVDGRGGGAPRSLRERGLMPGQTLQPPSPLRRGQPERPNLNLPRRPVPIKGRGNL